MRLLARLTSLALFFLALLSSALDSITPVFAKSFGTSLTQKVEVINKRTGKKTTLPSGSKVTVLRSETINKWEVTVIQVGNTTYIVDAFHFQYAHDQPTVATAATVPAQIIEVQKVLTRVSCETSTPEILKNPYGTDAEFLRILENLAQDRVVDHFDPSAKPAEACNTYNALICSNYKKLTGKTIDWETFTFLKGLIYHESHFDPNAYRREYGLSEKNWTSEHWDHYLLKRKDALGETFNEQTEKMLFEGSYGLFQILGVTAVYQYGYSGPIEGLRKPETNIYYGMKHFLANVRSASKLLTGKDKKKYQNYSLLQLAAAGYNAGSIQCTSKGLVCNQYKGGINYVDKVQEKADFFKTRCSYRNVQQACRAQ